MFTFIAHSKGHLLYQENIKYEMWRVWWWLRYFRRREYEGVHQILKHRALNLYDVYFQSISQDLIVVFQV